LEYWNTGNDGIVGFGKMYNGVLGKIPLERLDCKGKIEKFPLGIDSPIFHHSMWMADFKRI